MKFHAHKSIGVMDRLDFDRSTIEAILNMLGAKGYFIIDDSHEVVKIVNEVLPDSMMGVSIHEMLPEDFRPKHRKLIESVTPNHNRMMADGLTVKGVWEGEELTFKLSVAHMETLPEKWTGCRIGVVL